MRFKQYLYENEVSLDDLLKEAKVKCKPFLDNPTSLPILRGIRDAQGGFHPQPTNRKATSSGPELVFILNAGIKLAFNIDMIRSKSVFVSGLERQVEHYGDVTFYLPVGNYKSVWSPSIYDAFAYDFSLYNQIVKAGQIEVPAPISGDVILASLLKSLSRAMSVEKFLSGTKDVRDEVAMLYKNIFTHFDRTPPGSSDEVYDSLVDATQIVFQRLYQTDNLEKAVESGKEIMMLADGYLCLTTEMIHRAMIDEGLGEHWDYQKVWNYILNKIRNI